MAENPSLYSMDEGSLLDKHSGPSFGWRATSNRVKKVCTASIRLKIINSSRQSILSLDWRAKKIIVRSHPFAKRCTHRSAQRQENHPFDAGKKGDLCDSLSEGPLRQPPTKRQYHWREEMFKHELSRNRLLDPRCKAKSTSSRTTISSSCYVMREQASDKNYDLTMGWCRRYAAWDKWWVSIQNIDFIEKDAYRRQKCDQSFSA